jgi:hypothetical protein
VGKPKPPSWVTFQPWCMTNCQASHLSIWNLILSPAVYSRESNVEGTNKSKGEWGERKLSRRLEQKKMEVVLQQNLAKEWGSFFLPLASWERDQLQLEGKIRRTKGNRARKSQQPPPWVGEVAELRQRVSLATQQPVTIWPWVPGTMPASGIAKMNKTIPHRITV